ncbi:type II secretion system F family protein [Gimesia aquarii]|uniref:Type II secretion system protein F n=1 Tax=Gimesia aquarii TaxID=2527964 RepID=A0A517WNH5_9PLAN|nr:type II secretion system F family protein [Gimesia aquarii]QDU06810.1 Type II secretion system protein F [Gimesia aquarii]
MEILGLIYCLAFFVYFPIAGISSILLARRIKDYGHQAVNPLIKSFWLLFTMIMIFISSAFLICYLFLVITHHHSILGSLFLILPVILFFPIPIILEINCYRAASALNKGSEHVLPESLRNLTQKIQALGWISLGTPLILFVPVLIFAPVAIAASLSIVISFVLFAILFLGFTIIASLLRIAFVNKKANESELLWLLTVCVEKNIPLATELDTYSKTLSGKYREKIQQLSSFLHSGFSLTEALSATPGLVPQSTIVAARIGEKSNSLGIALRDAAVQTMKNLKQLSDRSNIANLILYLSIVVSIQFLITGFIMYWIIPKFKKIFLDFGIELPSLTLSLMDTSDFVISYFYLLLPFCSLPFIMLFLMYFGNYYGWFNLRIPFITEWFPRLNTPHCLRQIAQSVSVEAHPLLALETVSEFHRWSDVRVRTHLINNQINQGENIWVALRQNKVINSAEASLCATAEKMGNLPYVLRTLADTIEQRRARKLRYLTEIIKPVLISLLGIFVGLFVIAIFMPLIKILRDLI